MDADKSVIEPFDPRKHDRTTFSCGVEQVDNYFKKTANKLTKADNVRVFVMTKADGTVVGFCAINAHAIDYAELPTTFVRSRPGHGLIPAAYISMIGVDRRYAGHGYGSDLLVDALTRIARASSELGIAVVILDVLDDGDTQRVKRRKKLYESYGFKPLSSKPLCLYLTVATIRGLLGD